MIKLDYVFRAKSPVHTGSDTNEGTMKSLRRQKIIQTPVEYESRYTDEERRDAIVTILHAVHKSINWDGMKKMRLMGIWDEAYSKLLRAASSGNRYQFFSTLCSSWDVRSVSDDAVIDILDNMSDAELLETVRSEAHYLILKLRRRAKQGAETTLFSGGGTKTRYVKTCEMIPCVSGNSIRGVLRRLAMHDFCQRTGVTKLSKNIYHILFTGGVLNESTQYEDIDKREKLVAMNPMVGVFGSAIGNMTIEGMLSVGMAYPVCAEMGTGDRSYWEYLDTVFQTRHDSSKTEKELEVVGVKEAPTQMKYEYEVFSVGTPFSHGFRMVELGGLYNSAFWHVLKLFKENPFIGGMFAVGNAEIDLAELTCGSDELYCEYLEENMENIADFFNVGGISATFFGGESPDVDVSE